MTLSSNSAPPSNSSSWDQFACVFEKLKTAEEKLRSALALMKELLSQGGDLPFKEFWEARKLCLPLFKEEIAAKVRSELWEEYVAMTREGRELKNILYEEAAFVAEQISLAIKALETEIAHYSTASITEIIAPYREIEIPATCKALRDKNSYLEKQRRVDLLQVYAERIHSLRKELIKTPMRFRFKNQFFQQLSALGDQVFPPRRDLIQALSDSFHNDVLDFVGHHFAPDTFSSEKIKKQLFFFREEIKALQRAAKILTLNTQTFTKTRAELSHCWDQLKGMDKEVKKEFAEHKQKSHENAEGVREALAFLIKEKGEKPLTDEEFVLKLEGLLKKMRTLELIHKDVLELKEQIRLAQEPLAAKREEEERLKREKESALVEKHQKEIEEFKQRVESLLETLEKENLDKDSLDQAALEKEAIAKIFLALSLTKKEKMQLEKMVKRAVERLSERREESLLALSEDDRKNYENLLVILAQRKARRLEIKKQIEEYRKIIGGSSLDFSKAMEYNDLVHQEKNRLEKIEEGIAEIEAKIRILKNVS